MRHRFANLFAGEDETIRPRTRRSSVERITSVLPELYVVLALLSTVLLLLFMPPFLVSDEDAHSRRAYSIAHGDWLAHRTAQGIGATVDTGLADVGAAYSALEVRTATRYPIAGNRPDGRIPLSFLAEQQAVPWSHRREFVAFPNSATYPPTLYLPQALGWRVTEALDLSIVHSLLCVRLVDALCSITIGWLALRIGRINPWLLAAYLLLPTTLGLCASCSQDGLLVTIAALTAAILSRAAAEHRILRPREWVLATILFASMVMARPPYLPLVLLLLVPQLQATGARGSKRYLAPALAMLLVAGALIAWQAAAPATSSYENGWAGVDPKLQLVFLRSHPFRGSFNVVAGTLSLAPHLIVKAIYSLAWNDIYPPDAVYGLMILILACFGLCSTWRGLPSRPAQGLLLFGVIASILAISLAEYLIWTPVGGHKLEGPLARYYLPFVPFLLLFSSEKLRKWTNAARLRWIPMVSAAGFVLILLTPPWLLSHRFYNMGPVAMLRATLR